MIVIQKLENERRLLRAVTVQSSDGVTEWRSSA